MRTHTRSMIVVSLIGVCLAAGCAGGDTANESSDQVSSGVTARLEDALSAALAAPGAELVEGAPPAPNDDGNGPVLIDVATPVEIMPGQTVTTVVVFNEPDGDASEVIFAFADEDRAYLAWPVPGKLRGPGEVAFRVVLSLDATFTELGDYAFEVAVADDAGNVSEYMPFKLRVLDNVCDFVCPTHGCGQDDNCGGVCWTCDDVEVCSENQCVGNNDTGGVIFSVEGDCPSTAACEDRECGPDSICGVSCGTCPAGQSCTSFGRCTVAGGDDDDDDTAAPDDDDDDTAAPDDDDTSDDDATDDDLTDDDVVDDDDVVEDDDADDDDAAGDVCDPACDRGVPCVAGACDTSQCIPDCAGRKCGDNACGGSCGACRANQTCFDNGVCGPADGGVCEPPAWQPPGSTRGTFGWCHDNKSRGPNTGPDDPEQKWVVQTGAPIVAAPTITADGRIHVGSHDNVFYTVDAGGEVLWAFPTGGQIWPEGFLMDDDTIVIGSADGFVYSLSPDGEENWRYDTGAPIHYAMTVGPDKTIYAGNLGGEMHAINPDGSHKWTFTAGGSLESMPAIDANGVIYFGSYDGHLYAVGPDGAQVWAAPLDPPPCCVVTLGADGTVYSGSKGGSVYALDIDGTLNWTFTASTDITWTQPSIGADGTIYIGSHDFNLYALRPDGTEKWRFNLEGYTDCSLTIDAAGTIYIGADSEYLFAINPDGTEKWRYPSGDNIVSSPTIGPDGWVYWGDGDGKLHAIGPP